MRATRVLLVLSAFPGIVHAQAAKQAGAPADIPAVPQQIAAAVQALPNEYREGAKVLGYRAGNEGPVPCQVPHVRLLAIWLRSIPAR